MASYLIDDEATLVAARRLAAAIRAPLRATLRLLRTMPAIRLPACAASLVPPYASLHNVIDAMATLSHEEVANVLLHLHPLELIHLPRPLLRAGLSRYASPTTAHPLDLRDPLFLHHILPAPSMALPLWRAHCDHLLDIISHLNDRDRNACAGNGGAGAGGAKEDLPLAALKLSYTCAITSKTLEAIAGTLRVLQIFSPPLPAHISFLPAATQLTELSLVSACEPQGSLLAALSALPLLQTLEIVLPRLSPADTALLRFSIDSGAFSTPVVGSAACCSTSGTARMPPPTPLAAALANVSHAYLRTFTCDGGGGPAWPPLLGYFLPIPTLKEFTCHPYTVPAEDIPSSPLLRAAHTGAELRASKLSLCWPDQWPRWGGRPPATPRERHSVSGADARDVFTAAAAAMPQLRTVALDCAACDSAHLEPLLQLSHLQSLRLEDVQLSVVSAAAKWLQGLHRLCDLKLGLLPTAPVAPGADDAGRERLFKTLVEDLRLHEMPLTRLAFAEVPLTPATCGALGSLSMLRELSWTVRDAAPPHSDTVAAFAATLRSCSTLTAVRIPFWPRAADAGQLVAALVSLRALRELTVAFNAPAEAAGAAPAADADAVDAPPEPAASGGAPHACLLALESLHVHLTGGHGEHLMHFVERLNLQAPKLSTLKLQCDEAMEALQPETLVRTLGRVPHLHTLHLPGSCMQAADDVAVLGPAICALPRLQELVFWGSVGVMGEAWRGVVQLPLCRGLVEVPLRAEE